MRKYDYFWLSNKSWSHWDKRGERVINDNAPEEAKKSYARYIEQRKAAAVHDRIDESTE
ncbi:MAG: hypothetical protein K6C13_08840 [Oscillospiraceae bacterium]|jgi:hypothetical protein|nr:hypothetical protein [Oscillospiraceae bacterium]